MIPYTLEANDMRFTVPGGFPDGNAFFTYNLDEAKAKEEELKKKKAEEEKRFLWNQPSMEESA